MLVCHCHVVFHDEITAEIEAGARSPEALGRSCGAGTSCGGCHAALDEMLERAEAAVDRALSPA
jgi:bacterioferritin-associated ferredoxin